MKFKNYLIIAFLISLANISHGQIRHIKNVQKIDFQSGLANNGYFIELGYTRQLDSKLFIRAAISYRANNWDSDFNSPDGTPRIAKIPIKDYVATSYLHYTIASINNTIFLNPFVGASIGYQNINNGEKEEEFFTINAESKLLVGIPLGLEVEIYPSDNVAILISSNYSIITTSDIEVKKTIIGLGARFRF